jgi:glycine/sarcosine N-methyltransferase
MMYDTFASDYDRFVNWPGRLSFEMPFIESQLRLLPGFTTPANLRLLDAATGTGMHVLELARRGYQASGADLSAPMVERARLNAAQAGLASRFEVAGFGQLAETFHADLPFDALFCLGNSLPHLLSLEALTQALADFAVCLRPDGLLIVQNRNFNAVLEQHERWMEPQSYSEVGNEWVFLRFYDFEPSGLINFNILTLRRQAGGPWSQSVSATRLYPLISQEMLQALARAGFTGIQIYGGMNGSPFDPHTSGNLVIVARRALGRTS